MALAAANSPRSQVMKPSRSSMSQAAGSAAAAAAAAPGTGEVMTAAAVAAEAIAVRPSPLGARAHRKAQPSQQCRGGERSRVLPYIFVPMLLLVFFVLSWWWWCWNGDERKREMAGLAAVVVVDLRSEERGGGVKRRAGSGHPKIRETRGAGGRATPNDYVDPRGRQMGPDPSVGVRDRGSGG